MAIRRGRFAKKRPAPPVVTHSDRLVDEYKRLRRNATYIASQKEWDAAVVNILSKRVTDRKPTAEEYVQAAREAMVKCPSCVNGTYYWGACVNGNMTHSGPCFRCGGKGRQGQADFTRNWGYDQRRRAI